MVTTDESDTPSSPVGPPHIAASLLTDGSLPLSIEHDQAGRCRKGRANSATSQPLMIRGSVFFWARYSPGARRHWFNFPQGIASNWTSDRRTASFWASGVPAVRA